MILSLHKVRVPAVYLAWSNSLNLWILSLSGSK